MSAALTWDKGGTASVVSLEGDAIVLSSSIPSPPGSRLSGTMAEGRGELRVKVHASKKQEDGSFRLEGRVIDATRDVRAKIAALVAEKAHSGN